MYSPIKDLLKNAVEAGFIAEKNLALVQIVDLEDAAANDDESRAGEWGAATVKALKDWSLEVSCPLTFASFACVSHTDSWSRRTRVTGSNGCQRGISRLKSKYDLSRLMTSHNHKRTCIAYRRLS
jgi:hypothetical protein